MNTDLISGILNNSKRQALDKATQLESGSSAGMTLGSAFGSGSILTDISNAAALATNKLQRTVNPAVPALPAGAPSPMSQLAVSTAKGLDAGLSGIFSGAKLGTFAIVAVIGLLLLSEARHAVEA